MKVWMQSCHDTLVLRSWRKVWSSWCLCLDDLETYRQRRQVGEDAELEQEGSNAGSDDDLDKWLQTIVHRGLWSCPLHCGPSLNIDLLGQISVPVNYLLTKSVIIELWAMGWPAMSWWPWRRQCWVPRYPFILSNESTHEIEKEWEKERGEKEQERGDCRGERLWQYHLK